MELYIPGYTDLNRFITLAFTKSDSYWTGLSPRWLVLQQDAMLLTGSHAQPH